MYTFPSWRLQSCRTEQLSKKSCNDWSIAVWKGVDTKPRILHRGIPCLGEFEGRLLLRCPRRTPRERIFQALQRFQGEPKSLANPGSEASAQSSRPVCHTEWKTGAVTHKKFGIAMRLAALFNDKWQLLMFVAFLSLSRRKHTDDSIMERALQAINVQTISGFSVSCCVTDLNQTDLSTCLTCRS
jgi:hypothetical protein